jgi:hypothetical protein
LIAQIQYRDKVTASADAALLNFADRIIPVRIAHIVDRYDIICRKKEVYAGALRASRT